MKRFCLLLMLLLLVASPSYAATYANETSNFNGVTLGESRATIQRQGVNLTFVKHISSDALDVYTSDTQGKNFYNTSFDYVSYQFYKGNLLLVQATKYESQGSIYSEEVMQKVASKHGRPSIVEESLVSKTKTYTWFGNQTYMLLVYDYLKKEIRLYVYNYPLYKDWRGWKQMGQSKDGRIKNGGW